VVSLSWSPLGTRPVLLSASARGNLCVWTQTPQDDICTPHVRAVNRWYGRVLGQDGPKPAGGKRVTGADGLDGEDGAWQLTSEKFVVCQGAAC
jgi:hypothetical protein